MVTRPVTILEKRPADPVLFHDLRVHWLPTSL